MPVGRVAAAGAGADWAAVVALVGDDGDCVGTPVWTCEPLGTEALGAAHACVKLGTLEGKLASMRTALNDMGAAFAWAACSPCGAD